MRPFALISTLLLSNCISIAQPLSSWERDRLTVGMDAVTARSDRAEISRTMYTIAYPLPSAVPLVISYAQVETDAGLTYYQDIYKSICQ